MRKIVFPGQSHQIQGRTDFQASFLSISRKQCIFLKYYINSFESLLQLEKTVLVTFYPKLFPLQMRADTFLTSPGLQGSSPYSSQICVKTVCNSVLVHMIVIVDW